MGEAIQPTSSHVVCIGNVKGGTSKSTTAIHLCVALQASGQIVGAIDLDVGQQSFFRYLDNRVAYAKARGQEEAIRPPIRRSVKGSELVDRRQANARELDAFSAALEDLAPRCDVILIDCPGSDTYLSRLGHMHADTLLTPLSDSPIDLDLLARFDPLVNAHTEASLYAKLVWEARQLREEGGYPKTRWLTVLNRYEAGTDPRKLTAYHRLTALSGKLGFTVLPGIAERRLYRNLFTHGLTLFDIDRPKPSNPRFHDFIAAEAEMIALLEAIGMRKMRKVANG